MNPNSDSLYAGISGIHLGVKSFEIGYGIILSQTFAHLMAPLIMAFAPAESGKPHPEPWSSVRGGFAFDINAQIYIPREFELPNWFDRLNTVWWIVALIRLRTTSMVSVPVIASRPFVDIPEHWNESEIIPVEVNPQRLLPRQEIHPCILAESDLQWIQQHWLKGGSLMNKSSDFNAAFQAFDYSNAAGKMPLALIMLWSALEQLFSPGRQELRFRVSSLIASFLQPPGAERLNLYKKILKLYDARSRVVHSTVSASDDAYAETYHLMRRVLIKMIEEGVVPDRTEMEQYLFG